ncbi:MAG: dynamin family protein, partial [Blastocatellia bacterium]|nr:dynamin family protein [Blastocatellia bacterium]
MSSNYQDLRQSLAEMPHVSKEQVEKWIKLQTVIDECESFLGSSDLQQAKSHIEQAKKILNQRTYTLVFFGGSGYGKSTLINALLGRNILPAGTGAAITGTIIYIEQLTSRDEEESVSFVYLTREELINRARILCNSAAIQQFDITNNQERMMANRTIGELRERRQRVGASQDLSETEKADYQRIIQDFIEAYQNNIEAYRNGGLSSESFPLTDPSLRNFLREDSTDRKVRLVKTATIKIRPSVSDNGNSDLLMKGYLRIVDLPGLGASMRLHEDITLEEMKRE